MPDFPLIFRTNPVQYHFHMLGMNWIERSLELITDNGAAALNLQDYGIAEGLPARCIVLQGQTPYEVLLGQKPVKASVRDGRVLVDPQASGWPSYDSSGCPRSLNSSHAV